MSEVLIEQRGMLGVLTLNRPEALNSLTTNMCRLMLEALLRWRNDPSVKQVLVTGAGDRGLCAGGDIVAIYRDIQEQSGSTAEFWRTEYQLNALIDEYPKPYIALMDGIVLGGGIGISAHGSHRIVTERSRCGMPEVGIGFFPDVGGSYLLARAPRAAGRCAALTGMSFGAADAITLGLADAHVTSQLLAELTRELEKVPVNELLGTFGSEPPQGILDQEWAQAFEHADPEAIRRALLGSPQPTAEKALKALERACPSSVDLVTVLCDRAGTNLREDLIREFRAAVHRLESADFAEGIRAQVIDKDRTPRWQTNLAGNTLRELTLAHLDPLATPDLDFRLIDRP